MDAQLKSTTIAAVQMTEKHIRYELAARNYHHLRKELRDPPARLLLLFLLPDDETEWLLQDQQGMTMRHCCYYLSLQGFPETKNQRSVTVEIPRVNVFSTDYLQQLLQ